MFTWVNTAGTAATLVTDYREALGILSDPRYPADPRGWQKRVSPDCPALPTLGWRPDALRSSGEQHTRLRRAIGGALDRVDQYALRATVERATVALINNFCQLGSADLLGEFAIPLVAEVLDGLLGLSPETGRYAFDAIMTLREATDPAAVERGNRLLTAAIADAVAAKRAAPGADVTTWLIQYPAALDDDEAIHELAMLYATGSQPTWNLIANTLLLMMTNDRFGGDLLSGTLSPRDAIDEVLFTDPPLANAWPRFPPQMQIIAKTMLPEHQPVLISLAACNTDPAVAVDGDRIGNRSHLAWGAGPHMCPAQSLATVIVAEALGLLLDALSEIQLDLSAGAGPQWLPSPFHRALRALPVKFSPSPPLPLA